MNLFEILIYVVVFTPFIVLGFISIWTYRKNKKIGFYLSTGLFIIGIISLLWWMRILPGSSMYHEREYTKTITGHSFTFQKRLYNYDSPRSFHGDGYSITIYEIAKKDIDFIKEREIELMNDYPTKGEYRQNWDVEKWKKAPVDSGEYQVIEFAFSEYESNEDLKKWFSIIKKSLESEEVYYGYLYKGERDWPMNVDFYLIDKQKNRMVIINHNT